MLGRPLLRSIWFDNQCILGSSGSFIGLLITSSFNEAWLEVCTESSEFDCLDGYLGVIRYAEFHAGFCFHRRSREHFIYCASRHPNHPWVQSAFKTYIQYLDNHAGFRCVPHETRSEFMPESCTLQQGGDVDRRSVRRPWVFFSASKWWEKDPLRLAFGNLGYEGVEGSDARWLRPKITAYRNTCTSMDETQDGRPTLSCEHTCRWQLEFTRSCRCVIDRKETTGRVRGAS